jgi:signal transduction histidine kinase
LARLDRALSRFHLATEELSGLDRELAAILALVDRDKVLRETVRLLTKEYGFDVAWFGDRTSRDAVRIRHTSGNRTDEFLGLTLQRGCGLGGKVYAVGHLEWVDDYYGSGAITHDYDANVAVEDIQRMIAAPIVCGDQRVGVLLGGLRERGSFGNRAAAIVERVADRTADALLVAERARHAAELALHEERQRIAFDLHDTIGAMLFAITAGVRSATEEAVVDEALRERLLAIERQASEAAVTLRESLRALRMPTDQLALSAAIESVCTAFEERTAIPAKLVVVDVLPPVEKVRVQLLIAAAKEGLLNVEKHAQATSVVVTVAALRGGVAVTVTDDGVGLRPQTGDDHGFGLEAVASALAEQGGALQVSDEDDGGVSLRAWVPA